MSKHSIEPGIKGINVRFFMYDYEGGEVDIIEVSESTFIETPGVISYERNTVFLNGVNQICLTKGSA